MPTKPLVDRVQIGVLFMQRLGVPHAQQADQGHGKAQQEQGLGNLDPVNPTQNRKASQEKGASGYDPKPGLFRDIQQSAGVDPQQISQVFGGFVTLAPCARDHVERHAQNPMAGRGPDNGQHDPEPEVGKGPHVDQFKDG